MSSVWDSEVLAHSTVTRFNGRSAPDRTSDSTPIHEFEADHSTLEAPPKPVQRRAKPKPALINQKKVPFKDPLTKMNQRKGTKPSKPEKEEGSQKEQAGEFKPDEYRLVLPERRVEVPSDVEESKELKHSKQVKEDLFTKSQAAAPKPDEQRREEPSEEGDSLLVQTHQPVYSQQEEPSRLGTTTKSKLLGNSPPLDVAQASPRASSLADTPTDASSAPLRRG